MARTTRLRGSAGTARRPRRASSVISPEGAAPHRVHQHLEGVLAGERGVAERDRAPPRARGRGRPGTRARRATAPSRSSSVDRASSIESGSGGGVRVEERVHAHDGQGPVVLALLVGHGLVLDAPALVAELHRAEHPAALVDPLELAEHGLLDEVGELVDDVAALERVVAACEAPLAVDDELDRHGAADRLARRRRHRLVEGVGVQRVAVVVDRAQRLEGRADVVERHLLGVQRPSRGLDVVLQLLGALRRPVAVPHDDRPDAPRDPAEHGVLGVHAVGEEERQRRGEVLDVHPAREPRLDVGEPVRRA